MFLHFTSFRWCGSLVGVVIPLPSDGVPIGSFPQNTSPLMRRTLWMYSNIARFPLLLRRKIWDLFSSWCLTLWWGCRRQSHCKHKVPEPAALRHFVVISGQHSISINPLKLHLWVPASSLGELILVVILYSSVLQSSCWRFTLKPYFSSGCQNFSLFKPKSCSCSENVLSWRSYPSPI